MHFAPGLRHFSRYWLPIGLSQCVALACGLAGVHLATRWVRPEDLGVYGLFLSLVPIAGMLTHAGLIKHFARHWLVADDKSAYLRHWLAASLRPAGWLLLAGVAIGALRVLQPAAGLGAAVLVVGGLAGAGAQAFQLGVQSASRHWLDLGLTTASSGTRTFLPLLAVAATGWGLDALMGGYLAHAILTGALTFVAVRWLGSQMASARGNDAAPAESLDAYTRLFLVNGALALLNQGIVRWTVSAAFDDVVLGYVTMAGNLAAVGPSMLSGALWQYHYPRLLEARRTAGTAAMNRRADRMVGWYVGGTILGGAVLAALLPFLPGTLIADRYADALPYIMPLFAFFAGLCGLTLLQGEALVLDDPAKAVRVTVAGTIALSGGTMIAVAIAPTLLWPWLWLSPLAAIPAAWACLRWPGRGSQLPR